MPYLWPWRAVEEAGLAISGPDQPKVRALSRARCRSFVVPLRGIHAAIPYWENLDA